MANDSYGTFLSEPRIPYDPLWEGPLKKSRHCTNRFWLIGLLTFFIIWMIIAFNAFSNGNINKLIVPTDSEGRKCGIDLEVKDKPYLLFFDITKCANGSCDTTQVCINNCPTENFMYQKGITTLDEVKKKIICKININIDLITSIEQVDYYITQGICTKWYLKSESIIKRCIPLSPVPTEFNSTISNSQLNNAKQIIMQIGNLERTLQDVYHDIVATRYPVLGFIALSGIAAFLYIILLRWLAKPFVYTSIFIICTLLVYFIYQSSVQYSSNNSSEWLYALIFCVVSLIIIIISTIFLRKRIHLACQIIKESSKAVACIWSSLFFPIIPWILHILVLLLSMAVLFYLQTITIPNYQVYVQETLPNDNQCICPPELHYVNGSTCDPNVFESKCKDANGGQCLSAGCYLMSVSVPGQIFIYHIINGIAFLWFSFFVSAFGQMVLAATFSIWYWTFNKQDIPYFTVIKSFWITLRYHVGTLAFGSFVIWICDIVRILLKPIVGNSQLNGPISVQPIGFIRSIFDFLMRFLRYINHNAYIMCAIHGRGFCHSAKNAFNLVVRNAVRVIVVTNVTEWLLRIAKFFIVILTAALTMAYYTNKDSETVKAVHVPVLMALIGSYLVTTVFFMIHKAAVDTLFLCFLEDSERNDGSQERPYYMSMRLKQLLQK